MVSLEVRAKVNEKFFMSAVKKAIKLLPPPKNAEFFVIDSIKQCPFVAADLKGLSKRAYDKFCKIEKTSMSITVGKHEHIVIFIGKEDLYLKRNKTALIGTIIHEIMHTRQRKKNIDELIYEDMNWAFKKWKKKFFKLKYGKKKLEKAIYDIMDEAGYTLKDIYDNMELIDKGLGNYILVDYLNLYKGEKTCPSPIYFEDVHKAIKENLKYLVPAVNFQLSLLATVIPFTRWQEAKANRLARSIEKCYGISISKVKYAFDDAIRLVIEHYSWRTSFRRKYFDLILAKVYGLLT